MVFSFLHETINSRYGVRLSVPIFKSMSIHPQHLSILGPLPAKIPKNLINFVFFYQFVHTSSFVLWDCTQAICVVIFSFYVKFKKVHSITRLFKRRRALIKCLGIERALME